MIKMSLYLVIFIILPTGFVRASDFEFVGSYLLEYSIFKIDVYKISYYRGKNAEKLVLEYKTNVEKKYSIEGWKVGLKHKLEDKTIQPKAQWLFDNTVDLNSGDKLIFIKSHSKLEIFKNDDLVAKTSDPITVSLAFEPWLGERPIDHALKFALLGNSKNL